MSWDAIKPIKGGDWKAVAYERVSPGEGGGGKDGENKH
jgi:hypothetical protein